MGCGFRRLGLVGDSGFVGGELMRQLAFARTYNSRTIDEIAGEHFIDSSEDDDRVVFFFVR